MEIKFRTEFNQLLKHLDLQGSAVEIGVAEGGNAQYIASWPEVTKLFLIDSWTHLEQKGDGAEPQSWHDKNFKEAHDRVAPFREKVIFLQGLSSDMIPILKDDELIFAYIDGDHSYNGALNDLLTIYPKVKRGGVIAGHDYLNPAYGINKAVHDFLFNSVLVQYQESDIHVTEENGDESMVSFWFIKK